MPKVAINTNGIKKHISSFTPESAISEFVWNAFDAEANTVSLEFNIEEVLGSCNELKISDDGLGIPSDQLKFKFRPYYDSRKIVNKNSSLPHGHNGYGRFTFCAFSPEAVWETVYSGQSEDRFEYSITIQEDDLVNFIDSEPKKVAKKKPLGTSVTFKELSEINEDYIKSVILPYIKNEFAWFLVLYPAKKITLNEYTIDRQALLEDKSVVIESEKKNVTSSDGVVFEMLYVQWTKKLHNEYSKIYYLSKDKELFKENTRLNNKSDFFFHSVYVTSYYFEGFEFITPESESVQDAIFPGVKNRKSEDYRFVENEVYLLLKEKRSPFIEKLSKKLVSDYESDGVIEPVGEDSSPIERFENTAIKEMVEELYNIEPKIFSGFNLEQKKTFVGLLSTIITSTDAKNKILKIVKSVIELDESKQAELADLVDRVSLSGLINIAKLIEYRYSKYEEFKKIIHDERKTSYEKDVQKLVEENLWMLEEGYHLIGAEEDKFEKNLRSLMELNKMPADDVKIDHKDKNSEVDIFACRKLNDGNGIKHIIVELKKPTVLINNKCLQQLEKYIDVIQSDARFVGSDAKWRFYLIGNKLDSKIESKIDSYKNHGDPDLVFIDPKTDFRGYALSWNQVFDRFELRHQYLKDEIEKNIPKQ